MTEITTPRRRRRALSVVLAVLGVVLVLAGIAHIALGQYDVELRAEGQEVAAPGAVQPLRVQGGTMSQVEYVDRTELRLVVELHNSGRLPVTVTDAAPTGRTDARRLMRAFAVAAPDGRVTADGPLGAASVRIPGGETRTVVIRTRFVDCEFISSRSSSLLASVQLTYRLGWRTGEVDVALPKQYRASSPRDADCPNSTLDTRPPG